MLTVTITREDGTQYTYENVIVFQVFTEEDMKRLEEENQN